jgi:hypothetical protein
MRRAHLLPLAAGLLLAGCVTVPTGPSVMVLPGDGKGFDQFRVDDTVCRQWAFQQTGTTTEKAAGDAGVSSAAIGTAVGAATGAAIGAAYGNPGTGAAVGAGVGLLGGSAVGANHAAASEWQVQQRYDTAYMQCMYAKGHKIPIPAGSQLAQSSASPPPPGPPAGVPPPPPGNPPPPPPGPVR